MKYKFQQSPTISSLFKWLYGMCKEQVSIVVTRFEVSLKYVFGVS